MLKILYDFLFGKKLQVNQEWGISNEYEEDEDEGNEDLDTFYDGAAKLIILNIDTQTISITKAVTPEEAAIAIMAANSSSDVPRILLENGHENAYDRVNRTVETAIKGMIETGQFKLRTKVEDDDEPAISPTDAIKTGKM